MAAPLNYRRAKHAIRSSMNGDVAFWIFAMLLAFIGGALAVILVSIHSYMLLIPGVSN